MKLVFAGTPEFAVASLKSLYEAGFEIAAVLTQPDRPQGRKGILTPSPVKLCAQEYGIPVIQPERVKEDFSALAEAGADLMVTCAYGQILTREILGLFPLGVWNVHASLLPAYRGAAPIARAIMDGQERTGVTIMKTDVGMDTGDMFLKEETEILPDDTYATLSERLSVIGGRLIVEAVARIGRGDVTLTKQGEGFVCKKVGHSEVDFSRPAREVSAFIRALSPFPLAYATAGGVSFNFYMAEEVGYEGAEPYGTIVNDSPKQGLVVACGENAVKITQLQQAGGRLLSARDFLNGRRLTKGMRFDQPVL